MKHIISSVKTAAACAAIAWLCSGAANDCLAQNSATGLSPDLQEVVKLTQAKTTDDVIKNYIISTGKTYRLSADDIIYLSSQGVSPGVISTLQTAGANAAPPPAPQDNGAPPPPPVDQTPPPPPAAPSEGDVAPADAPPPPAGPEVNFQYFHDQLAPWGTWVDVPGVGACWQPASAVTGISPDWRPYYDNGQWVQTDNGLYWQSDYTWGDIPFHYGRWFLRPGFGWVWAPTYVWGPAWVFWRQGDADGCIGWAPLPFGAVFVNGAFQFHGVVVGADFNFGLGESCFTFVDYAHFHEGFFRMRGHEWPYHVGQERLHAFYARSVVRNEFRRDEHGRFINNGIGRDRLARVTQGRMTRVGFEERRPVGNREQLAHDRQEHANMAHTVHPGEPGGVQHAGPGNNGHPMTGNNGHPAGENPALHNGGGPGSVSKVFRPPTPAPRAPSPTPRTGGGGGVPRKN